MVKQHCYFVQKQCKHVLEDINECKAKVCQQMNALQNTIQQLVAVKPEDQSSVHTFLGVNDSEDGYGLAKALIQNRFGSDIRTWLDTYLTRAALTTDLKIFYKKPIHKFQSKRRLFVVWDIVETLLQECNTLRKGMIKQTKQVSTGNYVAYALHFPKFFKNAFRYVDNGYTPSKGFKVGDKVCTIQYTVDINKRQYFSTDKCNRPITNVLESHQYEVNNDEVYSQSDLYIRPNPVTRAKDVNLKLEGVEGFTTPTNYMSFMNVYRYEIENGDLMTKVPKIIETIERLDARDRRDKRLLTLPNKQQITQRHCVFTQSNLIMNMLPYFICHGYFIMNRLPNREATAEGYEWFQLAKNAKVRTVPNNQVEIKWPCKNKGEFGYYVPQGVTTTESRDNFLFHDMKGNPTSAVSSTWSSMQLYVPYDKRVVYLYDDTNTPDLIGNTDMTKRKKFKKTFTKTFFNSRLDSAHIILLDESQKEGLSLANVTYMHLNEVVSTLGDYEQATARIVRQCQSQLLPTITFNDILPFHLRFVSIFSYESEFPSQAQELGESPTPTQAYYYQQDSAGTYYVYKAGKKLCQARRENNRCVFVSDDVLALVETVVQKFNLVEHEDRIRTNLSLCFDSFYRQLSDLEGNTSMILLMNEWMKEYSFDYHQKTNIESFDMKRFLGSEFQLASKRYKSLLLENDLPTFAVPLFTLPDYNNVPIYTGPLRHESFALFAFLYKRVKLLHKNLDFLSFPEGGVTNKLLWNSEMFRRSKQPPPNEGKSPVSSGTSTLANTNVVDSAIQILLKKPEGHFVGVALRLARAAFKDSSTHANALLFQKQGHDTITVERFEPNGFTADSFQPALLNLAMEQLLEEKSTQHNITMKYINPLDQCAFNVNFSTDTSGGYCAPWSAFYLDYRLCNPDADPTALLEFIRVQWADTDQHKAFMLSWSNAALSFMDCIRQELQRRFNIMASSVTTIYTQFRKLKKKYQEDIIDTCMNK